MVRGMNLLVYLPSYCLMVLFVITFPAGAQDIGKSACERAGRLVSSKNKQSLQVIAGAFSSGLFPKTRYLDYGQMDVRLGWALSKPKDKPSIFRGDYEAVFALTNSAVLKGAGNFIGGFKLLLRYNFIQPDTWLIPYVQGGAGIVYNDVYKDENQKAIGQSMEFMPMLSAGSHFFIGSNWAVDLEVDYQHISNAGLDDRNGGNDAVGLLLGITHFF